MSRINSADMTSQSGLHHNSSGQGGHNSGGVQPLNGNGLPTTSRVFVQRDYRLGVYIRFMPDFPPELSRTGRIDQSTYEYTIKTINQTFEQAEDFNCATFCESLLGFLTANMLYFCKDTRYENCLKRVSKFVVEQNQRVYLPRGLQITDPVDRGLRCIEIVILNDESRS